MPLYETTFIARQDIPASDVEKLTEQFTKIITDNNGKVVKTEKWGLRNLAYIINKNRKGHYVFLGIDASADTVKELERNLRLNEDVLRFITIAVEEISKEPSAILQEDDDNKKAA